jgi:hypothetical protein
MSKVRTERHRAARREATIWLAAQAAPPRQIVRTLMERFGLTKSDAGQVWLRWKGRKMGYDL